MTTITNPEAIAAMIYGSMVRARGYANTPTPWQAGGNSLAQDEARVTADKIIKAIAAENTAQKALIARLVACLHAIETQTATADGLDPDETIAVNLMAHAAIKAAEETNHEPAAE